MLQPLELFCFGAPGARVDGKDPPRDVKWKKHLALLIYLALSPNRSRTREHLRGLLWSEKDEQLSRQSLNEAVRRLRIRLGEERLVTRGDVIEMSGDRLSVDAVQMQELGTRDPTKALAQVRGDFLEGFSVEDAPGFEEWAMLERERQHSRLAGILVKHADQLLAASRFSEAREAGRRALGIRPFDELAVRQVMLAASYGRDHAGALAAFHEFETQLATIGERPSRELIALAKRIREESLRPPPRPEDAEPPLVGRERIYQEAFAVLTDALAQGPGTLVVIGAPGMGRSRLLAESVTRLEREGAVVAQARPLESDHDAPWSTLRLLMRGGLAQAPGLVGADPGDLGILAGIVPDLVNRATPRQALDAAQVAAALKAVLVAVAEEKPLALVIDDAHLADGLTLGALRAALEALPRVPVALVVSALDPADGAPREWLELRGAVGRGLRGATVRLDAISDADLRRLVDVLAHWCKEDTDRDRLARRLSYETSGNPFFAVTLLRGLARMATFREEFVTNWPPKGNTRESPMFSLPDLTRTAIVARIGDLSKDGQRILAAASLCGLALDLDLLATLTELPRAQLDDHVTEAERRHLVRWDGERYAFAAPLIAEVVRNESLTPGQRTTLTRRAITALSTRGEFDARVLIAELKARALPGPDSFDEAAALTREAIEGAGGGARTARRAFAAAQRAAGKTPTAEQRETIHALQAAIGQLTG